MNNDQIQTTEAPPVTWADQLRASRAQLQLSQAQAAKLIGVPKGTFQSWEHTRHQPDEFKRKAILAILATAARRGRGKA